MLCAKLFRHELETEWTPPAGRTRQWFDAVVAVYGWALDTVLEHERLTLALAALTVLLTVNLYIVIPKGFFPTQDTGVLRGISVAPQSISFAAMAERQQALAAVILEDPDVESLSSFIGIDGVNMTMNSGRFLVFAEMPGANPETMAASVATPLERHLSAIADVMEMQSSNTMGSTNIFLMFGLHRNLDWAARDVQAAINAARADLPAALSRNPQYFKDDKAGGPILFVSLVSSFDRGVETRAGNFSIPCPTGKAARSRPILSSTGIRRPASASQQARSI